ncbi:MAG: hypothetical protein KJ914_02630 [Gammaproteobacteria bacterium]|nr:hypothetical protein [Gammaproteobacteria bacterium]MBU1722617.1 hypothetical protein [Gammaproteobacteria bacterium]MBU2007089.1 hypothetical protein [Gammaproteobacteria bacterium]
MQNIFLYASTNEEMSLIKGKLMDAFKDLNLLPTFHECIGCEDSFRMAKNSKFNAYIFFTDRDELDYFSALLKVIPTPTEKNKRIKLLFEKLPSNYLDAGGKIIHDAERNYFSVDKNLLNSSKESLASIIKFIFFPPIFFFSYGNEKGKVELGNSAREIIEEIELCFKSLFPNITPCKDYTCFEKSSIVENNLERVAQADYILMIINEKFFTSPFCMKEFGLILRLIDKNTSAKKRIEKFNEKVLLITSEKADEYMNAQNLQAHPKLRNTWLGTLERTVSHYIDNKGGDEAIAKSITDTINIIEDCIPFIRSMGNITRIEFNILKDNGYSDLMLEINKKMENAGYKTFYSDLHDPELEIIRKSKAFAKIREMNTIEY